MKYANDEALTATLDRVLDTKHYQEWRDSGVSPEIIRLNVKTIEESDRLKELLNFKIEERWKQPDNLVPGWFVSGVTPSTGEDNDYGQYKPDKAPVWNGKPQKYLSPSEETADPLFLATPDRNFWPDILADKTKPILLTEGAKKAGAALSKGFACISVPGVHNCQKKGRLHPALKQFCKLGRPIHIAYDADLWEKPQVFKALVKTGKLLSGAGAIVHVLTWEPSEGKGLDDWIVGGGDLAGAIESAPTLEEFLDSLDPDQIPEDCHLKKVFAKLSSILGDRIAFNALTNQVEIDDEPIEPELLRLNLALSFNMDIRQKEAEMIALYLARKNTYHPILNYLDSCPKTDPEFLDRVAPEILGVSDPLSVAIIRKMLISAVARVRQPGCKVDFVTILNGAQGFGKSSYFRLLCPVRTWFDDSFGNQTDKDERLKLHDSWICEWGELEAVFKRKDLAAVKGFITCQTDKVRRPYAAKAESLHRPSILVGSTNQTEFLADTTGNRRFSIIKITQPIDLERLVAWRDQIWGAANAAYLAGESWSIPSSLYEAQAERSSEFEFSDTWDETLEVWLSNPNNAFEIEEGVSTGYLLEKAIGLPTDRQERAPQMRLAECMKRLGWKTEIVGKKRSRVWKKIEKNEKKVDQVDQVDHPNSESFINEGFKGDQPSDQPLFEVDRFSSPHQGDQPQGRSTSKKHPRDSKPPQTHTPQEIQPISSGGGDQPDQPDQPHFDQNKNEQIQKGDRVIPAAKARWQRKGSQPLPPFLVPKGLKEAPEICVGIFEGDLFFDLVSTSRVLEVSADGQRVKVMSAGGRKSIFPIEDVRLLESGSNSN